MIKRIYIEITNACNLSCAFCPGTKRQISYMTPDSFSHVLEEVKPLTKYIYLHVQGEPLLHPDFETIMRIADTNEMKVQLVTNGSLLNRHPDLLRHSSLRKLSVSLQSAAYLKGIELPDYMDTICALADEISRGNDQFMDLRFWRQDELQKPADHYCLDFLRKRYAFIETDRRNSFRILRNVFISFANEFTWPVASTSPPSSAGTCLGTRQQLAVLSDLTVVPCCLDSEGAVPLGNLSEKRLSEVMADNRFQRMRDGFEHQEITEPFCRTCSFRLRFTNG